jgi:uncharacterized repeat protein (TIGR03803 family)
MRGLRLATFTTLVVISAVVGTLHAQYSVLYNFDPSTAGNFNGVLAQGRDGDLYGTNNGPYGVSKFTPTGTPTNLFSGNIFLPYGLTLGTDGNFYGTALDGGNVACGTVSCGSLFKITPTGTITVLHNFTGGADGAGPYYPPVEGNDGNFYGTTSEGGNPNACVTFGPAPGAGTIYKVTPSGTFTTLYQFDSFNGCSPRGPMVLGADGNFYGATYSGGIAAGHNCACGVVFKITAAGKLQVVHFFDGTNGQNPFGPLIQASDGSFYGTTSSGGTSPIYGGVVYKVTSSGAFTNLHSFSGTDGNLPLNGVMQATDSNFYGTTQSGGTCGNCGTVFRITPSGTFSVLYNFASTTGANPATALFQHTNGTLYGAAASGGAHNSGVFYDFGLGLQPFVSLLTTSGKAGQGIGILGQNFSATTSVNFGTGAATFTVVSDTYMTAVVPATGTTAHVTVVSPTGTLVSDKVFRVIPAITSFRPSSGTVGTAVVITGTGLKQTARVTFGGVKATAFTIDSATQVTAAVPAGAKTGKIAITSPGGTAASSGKFSVTPVIASFRPASGAPGTSVVITGTGLIQTTKVTFGGVAATAFTVNSDAQVTVKVPSGAITGKIAITTPGGTTTSSGTFTVT